MMPWKNEERAREAKLKINEAKFMETTEEKKKSDSIIPLSTEESVIFLRFPNNSIVGVEGQRTVGKSSSVYVDLSMGDIEGISCALGVGGGRPSEKTIEKQIPSEEVVEIRKSLEQLLYRIKGISDAITYLDAHDGLSKVISIPNQVEGSVEEINATLATQFAIVEKEFAELKEKKEPPLLTHILNEVAEIKQRQDFKPMVNRLNTLDKKLWETESKLNGLLLISQKNYEKSLELEMKISEMKFGSIPEPYAPEEDAEVAPTRETGEGYEQVVLLKGQPESPASHPVEEPLKTQEQHSELPTRKEFDVITMGDLELRVPHKEEPVSESAIGNLKRSLGAILKR